MSNVTILEDLKDSIQENDNEIDLEKISDTIEKEGKSIPKCVFERMDCLMIKYPLLTQKERLDMSYGFCSNSKNSNVKIFDFVNDIIGHDKLQELMAYRLVSSAWDEIRKIGSPILFDSEDEVTYEGKLYLKKISEDAFYPETAVGSSVVMSKALRQKNFYVRFKSSPDYMYKYSFSTPEKALNAFLGMSAGSPEEPVHGGEGSPGRFVWKNLRGKTLGPVFGNPKKLTPGGTSASLVPYDKMRYGRITKILGKVPGLEKLSAEMGKYKMEVKGQIEGATSGEPHMLKEFEMHQSHIYKKK